MHSTFRMTGLALAVALAAGLCTATALAQPNPQDAHAGHHAPAKTTSPNVQAAHEHDTAPTPAPAAGKRWATDEPLQDGMGRIRQAVTMLEHMEMGHVEPAQAPAFADQIQAAVNDMIANCKLPPDADAALHGLLVKFIAGATAVRTGPVTLAELKPMQDALAQYPRQFDDPTWDVDPEH